MAENYGDWDGYGATGASWHRSHCQNPFVQELSPTRYRVHLLRVTKKNRSQGHGLMSR